MNRRLFLQALALLLLSAVRVLAQGASVEFPVANFRPPAAARGYWVTENGRLLGHLAPSVQILGNYAHRPLRLVDTETDRARSDLIASRVDLELGLAMGFFEHLELGVVLPGTVHQSGDELSVLGRQGDGSLQSGFGDIRIIPKVRFFTSRDEVTTVALALPFSVPSGNRENLLGDEFLTFSPTAVLSFQTRTMDIAANVGVRLRRDQSFAFSVSQESVTVGNEYFASLGVKFHLWPEVLDLVGDAWFSTALQEQDMEEMPAEAVGGLRVYFGKGIYANAGGGAGLTRGIGAPEFRVLAGLGFLYEEDPDPDGDGLRFDDDRCPLQPEDRDEFEDEDGCPDLDDDQDGIPDLQDECPLEPEDRDGYADEDGCPDLDNDQDGILDSLDKCPDDAEDPDQFEDEDGCPELDNDQDGLVDRLDQCRLEPEDRDDFQDEDGCPDADNDGDRILDTDDKCPLEPEDTDAFEDQDGCPDLDNDQDGILDPDDQCPLAPEVINGLKDEDGCPDQKGPVQIEHGKITAPPVFFATGKDVILKRSFRVLQMVADTFRDNRWVKKVRIEGHTDNRGRDAFNQDLSQRRANSVMRFLIEAGVSPDRLQALGFGETQPIESNLTRRGRAANRRVEFVIVDPPLTRGETSGTVQPPAPNPYPGGAGTKELRYPH